VGKRSSAGREAQSSSKPGIVKRISKEHLLGYAAEENAKAAKSNAAAAKSQSPAPLNLYCPPNTDHVSSHGPLLVLPLLRAGVKETRHEFRSNVYTHISPLLCFSHKCSSSNNQARHSEGKFGALKFGHKSHSPSHALQSLQKRFLTDK
jgi:hypothetical protein